MKRSTVRGFSLGPELHHVDGLPTLRALGDVKLHGLALLERFVARLLNGAVVDEDVLPRGALDEAIPFGVVKPFHRPLLFHTLLLLGFNALDLSRATGLILPVSPG